MRAGALFLKEAVEGGACHTPLEKPRLRIEARNRRQFLLAAELGLGDRRFKDVDGAVIHFQGHREGMAVLAAMGEGETRGIGEAAGRAMNELGNKSQGAERFLANTWCQQKLRVVGGSAIGGRSKVRVQAAEDDVAPSDLVP